MRGAPEARAAVTGLGCVTALGKTPADTWSNICLGHSARAPLTVIETEGCRVREGAQAELPELEGLNARTLSRLSRASRLALPAARDALHQAGLLDEHGRSKLLRLDICASTTACGMEKGEEFLRGIWTGRTGGQAARVRHYQAQQQIREMQQFFSFAGPSMIVANACAGGGNAIGHAADLIRSGLADVVLAGGYEALCELVFAGFDCLQSLAPEQCRPFDKGRNGLMLGEGAAFLVLESEESARRRGAEILGFVTGYGHGTDKGHLTQPSQDGAPLEAAMRMALQDAQTAAGEIGYVNAHGTGTPLNDRAEASAFARIFDDTGARLSSTKAAIGHTLGAAGAIEAVLCLLALRSGQIPPQINLQDPEPLVADALARTGEHAEMKTAMSINLGFGGSTAALVFAQL
jgi:3-oxoacyl-[acyl-carrier-protein] synthase II